MDYSNLTLVSFASGNMSQSQCILHESFHGFHPSALSRMYNPSRIQNGAPEFWERNREVLKQERGTGYWIWKPLIVYESLRYAEDGRWIVYMDAGIKVLHPIDQLMNLGQDIVLFSNEWPHRDWCKQRVLLAMLGRKQCEFSPNQQQVQASVILIRKTPFTLSLVSEWLAWAQVPGMIDDSKSHILAFQEESNFKEHRHDQAILTNLAIREGINYNHWWPADYMGGAKYKYPDEYPVLFEHHRKRNKGTGNGQPEWE